MLAPGPSGNKGIQDGGQNGQQENMLRLSFFKLGTFLINVHVSMPS